MKNKLHTDVYAGIVMILFAAFWGKIAIGFPEVPRRFPLFIAFAFAFIGVLVALGGVRKMKASGGEFVSPFSWNRFKYVVGGFTMIAVYAFLMNAIHFFPATLFFVPVLMLFLRVRKPVLLIAADLILNGFLYLMFIVLLKIQLP